MVSRSRLLPVADRRKARCCGPWLAALLLLLLLLLLLAAACCTSRARCQLTAGTVGPSVCADTPLTEEQLDEAEAAWDRVKSGETDKSRDHAYLDTITHPFFEDVAKQVLRAPAVQLLETNPHDRPPGSGATSWSGGHLDVQITRSGWDATPRREMLAVWLWCNGVPHNRGAMR
jgi:hypothetical protein